MKKIIIAFLLILIGLSGPSTQAAAQGQASALINGTTPIDLVVREALNAWLATSAPNPAPFYAVTYVQASGTSTLVSLVALDLESPDQEWSLEDGDAVWLGTVRVLEDGTVQGFSQNTQGVKGGEIKIAAPRLSAGGGSTFNFHLSLDRELSTETGRSMAVVITAPVACMQLIL